MEKKEIKKILTSLWVEQSEDYPSVQRSSVETSIKRMRWTSPQKVFRINKINDYSFRVTRDLDRIVEQ